MSNVILDILTVLWSWWPLIILLVLTLVTLKNVLDKPSPLLEELKARKKNQSITLVTSPIQEDDAETVDFLTDLKRIRTKSNSDRKQSLDDRDLRLAIQYSKLQLFFLGWTILWGSLTLLVFLPLVFNANYHLPNLIWCLYYGLYTGIGYVNFKKGR